MLQKASACDLNVYFSRVTSHWNVMPCPHYVHSSHKPPTEHFCNIFHY